MNRTTKYGMFFLLIFLSNLNVQAQGSVVPSGGEATGVGGTVSTSIGQIVYTTNLGANFSLAQGVQQPYEISIELGLENPIGINLIMTISPNPTTDFVTLKIENYEFESLTYNLYDLNGKQLLAGIVTTTETQIPTGLLPSAIYFLKITNNNKAIKTFKIIKK